MPGFHLGFTRMGRGARLPLVASYSHILFEAV